MKYNFAEVFSVKCPSCERSRDLIEPKHDTFLCGCGNLFYWRAVVH